METVAPATGLFCESRTFPEMLTVPPCRYWGLSVETVIVRDPCEKTRGTAKRRETRRSIGSSFGKDDSEFTRSLEAFKGLC